MCPGVRFCHTLPGLSQCPCPSPAQLPHTSSSARQASVNTTFSFGTSRGSLWSVVLNSSCASSLPGSSSEKNTGSATPPRLTESETPIARTLASSFISSQHFLPCSWAYKPACHPGEGVGTIQQVLVDSWPSESPLRDTCECVQVKTRAEQGFCCSTVCDRKQTSS